MRSWASAELAGADLGDRRLDRRLERLVEGLSAQPTASIPQAMGDWAATKAAYRCFDHEAITPEQIDAAARPAVVARVAAAPERVVLSVQDTTLLDYTHHPTTTGLGPLAHPRRQGVCVHTALAVLPDGQPLGVLAQETWARDPEAVGQARQRRQRAFEAKESARWTRTLAASLEGLPATVQVGTVADREADIFAVFAAPRPAHAEWLIRATHDRALAGTPDRLWTTVGEAAPIAELTLTRPATETEPARTAHCTLRTGPVRLNPPRHRPAGSPRCEAIALQALLVCEEHPPLDVEPLCWLLLTTLPVREPHDALRYLTWYTRRWIVERDHFVLKSGCRIEPRHRQTAARLQNALAVFRLVAYRLLALTYAARETPDVACTVVLTPAEWQALCCTIQHVATPPATPPSLRQAIRWIARLGGFLARTHDGEPGVQVLWRGLMRLHDLTAMYTLLRPPSTYG